MPDGADKYALNVDDNVHEPRESDNSHAQAAANGAAAVSVPPKPAPLPQLKPGQSLADAIAELRNSWRWARSKRFVLLDLAGENEIAITEVGRLKRVDDDEQRAAAWAVGKHTTGDWDIADPDDPEDLYDGVRERYPALHGLAEVRKWIAQDLAERLPEDATVAVVTPLGWPATDARAFADHLASALEQRVLLVSPVLVDVIADECWRVPNTPANPVHVVRGSHGTEMHLTSRARGESLQVTVRRMLHAESELDEASDEPAIGGEDAAKRTAVRLAEWLIDGIDPPVSIQWPLQFVFRTRRKWRPVTRDLVVAPLRVPETLSEGAEITMIGAAGQLHQTGDLVLPLVELTAQRGSRHRDDFVLRLQRSARRRLRAWFSAADNMAEPVNVLQPSLLSVRVPSQSNIWVRE